MTDTPNPEVELPLVRFAVIGGAGAIKWWGMCRQDDLESQAQHGAAAVDITDLAGWARNPEAFVYDFAAQVMRPRSA